MHLKSILEIAKAIEREGNITRDMTDFYLYHTVSETGNSFSSM